MIGLGGVGLPGRRHSIGLARWWHLGIDTLWLANGIVFFVLLFTTGQWMRLVPLHWDVFPNALSVAIQYLSLDWPTESGWSNYNSLQLLAYFITVFLAAPLALLTGLGMSPALSTRFRRISSVFSIQFARSVHFLVLAGSCSSSSCTSPWSSPPGAAQPQSHVRRAEQRVLDRVLGLRRLDGGRDRWMGGGDAVHLPSPAGGAEGRFRADRTGAAAVRAHRLQARPVHREGHLPVLLAQRQVPGHPEYKQLPRRFRRLSACVGGLVENPVELDLDQLRALAHHEQITQHFCIQGWSGVAKWGGVSMQTIVDLVRPMPEARWVVFYSFGDGPDGGLYYDAQPIEQMSTTSRCWPTT